VDQRQPAFRLTGSLPRHRLSRRQLAHQVENLPGALRRVEKHFFVKPLDVCCNQADLPRAQRKGAEIGRKTPAEAP
jgi:hypothetical protein